MVVSILKSSHGPYSKEKSMQTLHLQAGTNGNCFICQVLHHRAEICKGVKLISLKLSIYTKYEA